MDKKTSGVKAYFKGLTKRQRIVWIVAVVTALVLIAAAVTLAIVFTRDSDDEKLTLKRKEYYYALKPDDAEGIGLNVGFAEGLPAEEIEFKTLKEVPGISVSGDYKVITDNAAVGSVAEFSYSYKGLEIAKISVEVVSADAIEVDDGTALGNIANGTGTYIITSDIDVSVLTRQISGFSGKLFGNHRILSGKLPKGGLFASMDGAEIRGLELSADSEQYRLQDGILFNKAGTELILYPRAAKAECYHIPPGVTSIGDGAFAGCTSLKKIVLPPWLQKVGKGAFSHCCGLQEIQFLPGTGGINIEEEAFSGCTALQELTLPEGMEGVKKAAFAGCEQLHRINLPASMKRLGNYAFSGCKALHKIDLPEKLAAIGFMTFSGCGLTEMIFPKSIRYIDNLAFENCSIFKFVYRGGQDDWIEKVDLEDDAFAQSGAWGVDFLE